MENRGVGVMEGVFQRYRDRVRQNKVNGFSLMKKVNRSTVINKEKQINTTY